ncbi:MAG: cobalamin biosynthesis protein [Desulfobacterota bacterium]|nr:cobalamin biosynthesis protein [Thermodesulfobacteriota bacterium]
MKIAIIAITPEGRRIGQELCETLIGSEVYLLTKPGSLRKTVEKIFDQYEGLVFVMALGIVIRVIAPFIKSKYEDPAVVVVDEGRRFAISALSGHEGGANLLAVEVGSILGAEPVITTASEAKKDLIVGVGCRKGTSSEEIIDAIDEALRAAGRSRQEVRWVVSIDLKREEPGLRQACQSLGIPFRTISSDLVKRFSGPYRRSSLVKEKIGVEGVCEPCALIAGRRTSLLVPKHKRGRVCVAIAREN